MVYAEFGGQTVCIMGNWKIENTKHHYNTRLSAKECFSVKFSRTEKMKKSFTRIAIKTLKISNFRKKKKK